MDPIKKNWSFLSGLVILIYLIWFLLTNSILKDYEYVQIARLLAIDQCFMDSQIPCRWVPGLENFFGSPIYNYYPPLPYYFGELIFFVTKSLTISARIILSLSLLGSYIFVYFFALRFLGKLSANLSAIFYTFLSFLSIVFYKEGLGLSWGLMFFPLVLLSLDLLSRERQIQTFLFFSISLSLLILSSSIAFILIGLILFWIIYQYIKVKDSALFLLRLYSMLLSILLSSFYLFPSILERNFVHSISENNLLRFLPKSVAEKPSMTVDSPYQILTGDSEISNFRKGTNWLRFETNTATHTIIRLSQFYFPNWKIFIDGRETQVEYKNNSLGLITIILGKGNHLVEGKLFDTPIRLISNIVTVVSVIFVLILLIIQFKAVRYWLNYYKKRVT